MMTTLEGPQPRTTPVTQRERDNRIAYYQRWSERMYAAMSPLYRAPQHGNLSDIGRVPVDVGINFLTIR